jgi:hypothetical protein
MQLIGRNFESVNTLAFAVGIETSRPSQWYGETMLVLWKHTAHIAYFAAYCSIRVSKDDVEHVDSPCLLE